MFRNTMYYLCHVVHICAEPHKSSNVQEHGVLPGLLGTYLRKIPLKMYCAGTWCTSWATWDISAQNPIKDVLRRNMMYYLGHAVLEYWQANTADIYIRVRKG
jgi:hypothetical protein